MKMPALIGEMQEAVARHKKGELVLGWRIRLWSAMNDGIGKKEATLRRNVLALLVARDTFPVWEEGHLVLAVPPEDIDEYYEYPRQALDEYRRFLLGKSSLKKVAAIYMEMRSALEYWEAKPHMAMQAAYVAIMAVAGRLRSFDDVIYQDRGWFDEVWDNERHLKITDDSLGERENCEVHYFAANLAGELAKKKVDGRREFWQQWLSERVPAILSPVAQVKALL